MCLRSTLWLHESVNIRQVCQNTGIIRVSQNPVTKPNTQYLITSVSQDLVTSQVSQARNYTSHFGVFYNNRKQYFHNHFCLFLSINWIKTLSDGYIQINTFCCGVFFERVVFSILYKSDHLFWVEVYITMSISLVDLYMKCIIWLWIFSLEYERRLQVWYCHLW
jgi:hypothetical protein